MEKVFPFSKKVVLAISTRKERVGIKNCIKRYKKITGGDNKWIKKR